QFCRSTGAAPDIDDGTGLRRGYGGQQITYRTRAFIFKDNILPGRPAHCALLSVRFFVLMGRPLFRLKHDTSTSVLCSCARQGMPWLTFGQSLPSFEKTRKHIKPTQSALSRLTFLHFSP